MRLLWIVAHAALGVLAIAYWDIYLFKRYLDEPWVICLLLAAVYGTVALLRGVARRVPVAERGRLARGWAGLDGRSLLYVAVFLALAGVLHFAYMRAASDGRAYFLMVRSLVIDWDVRFEQDVATFGYKGGVLSYALGTPLMWIPFYLAAHVWLGIRNLFGASYPTNGFFNPYQRSVGFGTLVIGMVALLVVDRLLRRHFSPRIATSATLAVAAGGWLFWYMAVDAGWSHAASALSVALFVSWWDRTRKRRSAGQWAVFGALGGLMILVRWQNIFFAIFPAADALGDYWRVLRGNAGRGTVVVRTHLVALACAVLAFFPQMLVWRLGRGGWLSVPAGDHPIYWDSRFLWDSLFHLDRGVFTWTPLMALALLGLLVIFRRDRRFALLLLVAFALQVWINGTLWWGNHGFGARRFANCFVIFALGLAALLDWSRRRPWVAPASIIAALLTLNVFFMREVYLTPMQQQGKVTLDEMISTVTKRVGHPLALPRSLWLAYAYGSDLGLYGRLGDQTFNNLEIDIGAPGDDRFLGGGWSGRERSAAIDYRWAIGRRAFVVWQARASAPYALEIVASPFLYDDAPTQFVEVIFNGDPVGAIELEKDLRRYRIEIDEEFVRAGLNGTELRFATATSPADQGISNDARQLAVRFDRIDFLRLR